jgi:hypothetical protein
VFRPSNSGWFLRYTNTAGTQDASFIYGDGADGDIPIVGDWNGSGATLPGAASTIGVFRPAGSRFNPSTANEWILRYTNTGGSADLDFYWPSGDAGTSGDIPVVGDWTGGGTTTVGFFRPSTSTWVLHNCNAPTCSTLDISFVYGDGVGGDQPVAGDWDGNGTTTIGVFRPAGTRFNTGTVDEWILRNSNTAGNGDLDFLYGGPGDLPIVGDWDGNRTTTIGVFRAPQTQFNPATADEWILRNSNTAGNGDLDFLYGGAGDRPVAGGWKR